MAPLTPDPKGLYDYAGSQGSRIYVRTTDGAPRGRIIAIDLTQPAREHWEEVVAEAADSLDHAALAGGRLLLSYLHNAHARAVLYSLATKTTSEVPFDGIGSANWSPAEPGANDLFYSFVTFTAPAALYRLDVRTGRSTLLRRSKLSFDAGQYQTDQVFYPSKDGAKVSMFLIHRKGMPLDGNNPTVLYGYGGFNLAMTPSFRPAILEWLEMGGLYAEANLRGGSEYGEAWHLAGARHNKQNVFDDFIAAAEWLIGNRYTSTPKLAIFGGSNGGLLVGACLNQRPDLFGAAMPAVGVMDMLRFNQFTAGAGWVGEFGSPDDAEDFKALLAYSPLHNIRKTSYPATLITTSDHDDRVVPGHSFKYAATLQESQQGAAPILIRIETRAGHGAGTPTSKTIDEFADRWAFLVKALDFRPKL
jgi:prolyl oligopeptidase